MNLQKHFPLLLALVLLATALLWSGVAGIRVNADDYEGLAAAAPIHSIGDVFRPFVIPDPNPAYFRPASAITMSLDFLLFGWNGPLFHLTSLLTHLLATLLVFYVARDVFDLTMGESLLVTFLFGIAASHESNLTVDAMRVDVIVTIFVLLTLLLELRARARNALGCRLLAVVTFAMAVLAKESAIVLLVLLPALLCDKPGKTHPQWQREGKMLAPYLIATVALYVYRAHFTTDPFSSQVLSSQGTYSLFAAVRNGAYALGYTLLPLNFETATTLLTSYGVLPLVAGGALTVLALWILFRGHPGWSYLWKPLVFMVLTGLVLVLSFERWRVYTPSAGLFAFLIVLIHRNRLRGVRTASIVLGVLLAVFHVWRALDAQTQWRASTAMKDKLMANLTRILDSIPQRPLTLGILVDPAKLGSASVMIPCISCMVQRAEADRLSERNHQDAALRGVKVFEWAALLGYAEDPSQGFHGLRVKQLGPRRFEVTAAHHILLYPGAVPKHGVARRDFLLEPGMTFRMEGATDSVERAHSGAAQTMLVTITDTAAAVITYVPGSGFVHLKLR